MQGFFNPRSVAIVGASADANKGGYALVANLLERMGRRLYPVNPRYESILGLPCFASVRQAPEVPDLAIIFLPPALVPAALQDCGLRGVKCVMIESAGFAEVGEEGRRLQAQCLEIAAAHGMRLWGPNCMGLVDGVQGLVLSFMPPSRWQGVLKPGPVSLIVQSGALAGGFLAQILSEGYFGLSKACSLGNRCDVNECDVLEQLAQDPHTRVVAMYLESLADPPRFRRVVEGLGRPVVLIKGGLSEAGARAALSHTGSLAGNAALAEGFFRQLGIHRAFDFVEMMDLAKALALWQGRRGGPRVGVITWSGGAGIVNSDHLARQGLTLASLSASSLQLLRQVYPPWMEPGNPADIWPAIEKSGRELAFRTALEAMLADPQVDAVQVHHQVIEEHFAESVRSLAAVKESAKPVAVWLTGDTACFRRFREEVEALGCPVYTEIGRGVRALSLLAPRVPAASILD